MRKIWLVAALLVLMVVPVWAQSPITVDAQNITSEFRNNITATISAHGQTDITEVEFFYRVRGQPATTRNDADFSPGTQIDASFAIDQTSIYFPPGTVLEYWWKLTDANGETLKTDKQTYEYIDNRHDFKVLSNDRVSVYWYRGDDKFGQALFDQANVALDRLENTIGVKVENQVKIFIYGSHQDLLDAIAVGAQEWTGGQAFTDFGVVVIGVSPSNLDWGLKATTHELTHLVIHQATDNPYGDLPRWLDEGLAVYNEDPDTLDVQFRHSFESAVKSNSLMTLQTLSSSFPADPEAANLAYGESGAVVKFIIDTYGGDAMKKLLDIFSEGELYDKALKEALGTDTHGLDNAWRASLGLPPLPDFAPAQPENQSQNQPVSAATPQSNSAAQAQPAPTAAPQPEKSGGLPCVSGAIPLALFGMVWVARRKK